MESEASCRSTAISEDEIGRCLEDDIDDEDCCCSCSNCPPHIFTSILLGLLACVLVSGGVFLAFHKWDHTWLLVSAVGVILMIIGTALHCCSASKNDRKKHRCKGGCGNGGGRNSKPDPLSNGGGMLAEQLLPLSNARSVSQLSLNMVPGYFPPVVYPTGGPYGLEQHSAVVQNISRLVQHQQQLHLQVPTSTTTANGDGARSFILLSLPADANAANIQNLVNAVCQLDANNQTENSIANNQSNAETEANSTEVPSPQSCASPLQTEGNGVTLQPSSPPVVVNPIVRAAPPPPDDASQAVANSTHPALKNVEVQTCNNWPSPATSELKLVVSTSSNSNGNCASQPADTGGCCSSSSCSAIAVSTDDSGDVTDENTQRTGSTDDCLIDIGDSTLPVTQAEPVNVICDTEQLSVAHIVDIPPQIANGPVMEVGDLMDITSDLLPVEEQSSSGTIHSNRDGSSSTACDENCVDSATNGSNEGDIVEGRSSNGIENSESRQDDQQEVAATTTDVPSSSSGIATETQQNPNFEEPSESSSDFEEDSDLMDRSSPPPSYEDVTQESQTPAIGGAIGLAYGTL